MKRFTKAMFAIIVIAMITLIACIPKITKAEGENESTYTVNFFDKNGNAIEFADYSKAGEYYLYSTDNYPLEDIPYTYEWSNGDRGTGHTDSDGKLVVAPTSTTGSSNLTIKIVDLPVDYAYLYSIGKLPSDYYNVVINNQTPMIYYDQFYGGSYITPTSSVVEDCYYGYDNTAPGVINISFKDYVTDENISFDQYDAIGQIKVGSNAQNLPYTYEWSDGTTGSGTTDSTGTINILSYPTEAITSLKVTVNDIQYRSRLSISNVNDNVIDKVNVNGQRYSSDKSYMFFADTELNVDYYTHEYSKSGEINIHFKHLDGTDWILSSNTSIHEIIRLYKAAQSDNRLQGFTYSIDFGNGYTLTGRNEKLYSDLESAPLDKFEGCKDIKITINMDENALVRTKLDKYIFGKLEVNGEVVEPGDWFATKDVSLNENGKVDITVYYSVVDDARIGVYSYDGTLTDEILNLKYLPRFNALEHTNSDIDDYMYWIVEGDDTKHYYDEMTQNYDYLFIISSKLNQPFTIHNIPRQERYGWHNADGSFACYSDFLLKNNAGGSIITINDQPATIEVLDELGIYPGVYIETKNEKGELVDSSNSSEWITTSGAGPKQGYDYRYNVVRKASTFMFQKNVNQDDPLAEDGKSHHFKIKLTDILTEKPVQGKVAYYIFDNADDTYNAENIKYADIDSEGKIDVYVKPGQFIKLGQMLDDDDILQYLLYQLSYQDFDRRNPVYAPELGALPYNVAYEIEEVDDDYEATLLVEETDKGNGIFNPQLVTMEKDGQTAQEFVDKLGGAQFVNTRKQGALAIKTDVKDKKDSDPIKYVVKITDAAKEFPEELTYTKADGTSGTIRFSKGDTVTIKDRDNDENTLEATEYTAEIELNNKDELTIEGLPSGAKYEVIQDEESANKYKCMPTDEVGYIKPDNSDEISKAVFTDKKEESNIIDRIISGEPKTGDIILISAIVLAISVLVLRKTKASKKQTIRSRH